MGGVRISGLATAIGYSIRWTGRCGANCNYGFDASISVPGGLRRNDGAITFFMAAVGCIEWWVRGAIWKACGARRRLKMIGEPYVGKPQVRFDEGMQETCVRVARMRPTLRCRGGG